VFLPFASAFNFEIAFIEGDGVFVLFLAGGAAALFAINKWIWAGAAGLIAGLITGYDMANMESQGWVSSLITIEIGAYVVLLGCAVMVGAASYAAYQRANRPMPINPSR
jgi:hypothetical protein